MSGRSFRPELVALALAACSSHAAPAAPEADPAQAIARVATLLANAPAPGSVKDCTHADLVGGLTMTHLTMLRLAGKPIATDAEHADWINPAALDAAPARALLASRADRQAAAAFLAAPFYVAYRIDSVDAPLAMGIKELKIGTIGARVIRYEPSGRPSCAKVFMFQNDQKISDDAIAVSDKTLVDPAVEARLQQDLAAQLLAHAPR